MFYPQLTINRADPNVAQAPHVPDANGYPKQIKILLIVGGQTF
jgi:hypothetical protein